MIALTSPVVFVIAGALLAAPAARRGQSGLAKLFGRDAQEMTQEEDDADLYTRSPHHKGKGKKNARDVEDEDEEEDRE